MLNEAKAGLPENKPVSAPMPPTPTPAPVRKVATAQDVARRRSQNLRGMDRLVAIADDVAASRLKRWDLSDVELLCLWRVRAIITYGASLHYQTEERLMEQSLQCCLMLKDKHRHAVRSGNPLWWSTVSPTKTDPRHSFRTILKDYPNTRQDACRKFFNWSEMVERAARAARRPGHLSRVCHPVVLQSSSIDIGVN